MKSLRFSLVLVALLSALAISVYSQGGPASPQGGGAATRGAAQAPDNSKPSPNQNQLPPISITSGLVHLVVTVTDRHRSFITDLDQSDFKVMENGTPQDIRFFGRETDLPLRIGLTK